MFHYEIGEKVITHEAVCLQICAVSKTPICLHFPTIRGFITAGRHGRRLYEKNANMDVCIFFFPTAHSHAVGCSPPFEPLMWVCDRSLTTWH
jgi:hypothetical protein